MKDFAPLFSSDIPGIRLEGDKEEGDEAGGRKETDGGGCNVGNREE